MDNKTLRELGIITSQALAYQDVTELKRLRLALFEANIPASLAAAKVIDGYLQLAEKWQNQAVSF